MDGSIAAEVDKLTVYLDERINGVGRVDVHDMTLALIRQQHVIAN